MAKGPSIIKTGTDFALRHKWKFAGALAFGLGLGALTHMGGDEPAAPPRAQPAAASDNNTAAAPVQRFFVTTGDTELRESAEPGAHVIGTIAQGSCGILTGEKNQNTATRILTDRYERVSGVSDISHWEASTTTTSIQDCVAQFDRKPVFLVPVNPQGRNLLWSQPHLDTVAFVSPPCMTVRGPAQNGFIPVDIFKKGAGSSTRVTTYRVYAETSRYERAPDTMTAEACRAAQLAPTTP